MDWLRFMFEKIFNEESPGSANMRYLLTAGGGNPRESATENTPPHFVVRLKWRGKSSPLL